MSVGEAEAKTPLKMTKRRREPLRGEALLAFVAEKVLEGATASAVARAASIPYPHAVRLRDELFGRLWSGLETRYSPEVLGSMKAEMTETLIATVAACKKAGMKNPKAFTHSNAAIKLLNQMYGFNAPTQIETTDRKLYALINPVVHARIMADPKARAALLELEEFASAQENAIDVEVIDSVLASVDDGGES